MSFTVKSGDELLRLPFYVSDKGLFPNEQEDLISLLNERLGAEFFRDKELYIEVLRDMAEVNENPFAYDRRNRYHRVGFDNRGRLRLSPAFDVTPGSTVYACDQIESLVDNLTKLPLCINDTYEGATGAKDDRLGGAADG